MVLPAGTMLGRYELRAFLGGGTFGEVYRAFDSTQGDEVAVKLLKAAATPAGPWVEAQVLTELRSDYILPVRNADAAAGVPYIVTELATHGAASARMAPIGVPPAVAIRWVRAACRGAARTHDALLLHRDIKPENLFLTQDDEALLGDFGIAAMTDAAGSCDPAGSLCTMAPEVAANGRTTTSSDVYSLGATLYALLTGRYAHNEPDPAACRAQLLAGPGPPIRDLAPHVTQALAARVDIAMARLPADRYITAAAFDAALGDLPASDREWSRSDEHFGHAECYRGEARGAAAATVCAIQVGARFQIEARYQPTGRQVPRVPPAVVTAGARARALRVAMRRVP